MADSTLVEGGYGAVSAHHGLRGSGFSGRRAAMCIGVLLAACVFLALSSDSERQLPAALFGRWGGEFTSDPVFHAPVYSSVDSAKTAGSPIQDDQFALDKTLSSKMGEDAPIGRGVGISGRWSSSFSQPALPSTGLLMC